MQGPDWSRGGASSKRIMCLSHEVVRFPVFKLGVLATFIYQDFLKQAESLYNELDLTGRGKADKHLCEAVIYELHQAVLKTMDDPIRQARNTIAVM